MLPCAFAEAVAINLIHSFGFYFRHLPYYKFTTSILPLKSQLDGNLPQQLDLTDPKHIQMPNENVSVWQSM